MTNISIEAPDIIRGQPYPGAPDNWKRFFTFSTDHKVIGIQYIVTSFVFFLVGGLFAMIMRGELITPEADLVDRTVYNALFTMHGSIMLFFWTFPVLVGLGNYLVPLMIGARDMAFPRLNAVSFWMIPIAGVLMLSSFLIPGGPSQSGWWAYPPCQFAESNRKFAQRASALDSLCRHFGCVLDYGSSEFCYNHF
jgi:cytochrome c oxidase subunit 1